MSRLRGCTDWYEPSLYVNLSRRMKNQHTDMCARSAKTGIRPVWSDASLSAWSNIGPLKTTYLAHSEDSDHLAGFVMRRLINDFQWMNSGSFPTLVYCQSLWNKFSVLVWLYCDNKRIIRNINKRYTSGFTKNIQNEWNVITIDLHDFYRFYSLLLMLYRQFPLWLRRSRSD